MKKLLLFACLIFAIGCSKSDDGISKSKDTGLMFYSYEKYKLSTGEELERGLPYLMVRIWDANEKDFDFNKSSWSDLMDGYLWDTKTQKSYRSIDSSISDFGFTRQLKPGKYVIYIMYKIDKNTTESHSQFEVKDDYIRINTLSIEKWVIDSLNGSDFISIF